MLPADALRCPGRGHVGFSLNAPRSLITGPWYLFVSDLRNKCTGHMHQTPHSPATTQEAQGSGQLIKVLKRDRWRVGFSTLASGYQRFSVELQRYTRALRSLVSLLCFSSFIQGMRKMQRKPLLQSIASHRPPPSLIPA